MFVSLSGAHEGAFSEEEKLAKSKIAAVEDGLKSAAVAVGTAIGSLVHKVGIGSAPKKKSVKKAVKKAPAKASKKVVSKKAAPKKKVAAKKVVAKKVAAKKSPAKKK